MIFNISWWVIVMVVFIVFSGYMAYRANSAEKKLEHQFIEKEGSVYIDRMKSERMKRQHGQM